MTYTSDRPIYVDGVRLDTLGWNIEQINRAVAGRRSSDAQVPGRDGVIPSLNDDLEPTVMGLEMFVMGTDADGVVPPEGKRDRFWANLDELIHLFGKRHGLLEVWEQTGPGEYARNLAENPKWAGAPGAANTNVVANYVPNPAPASASGFSGVNGGTGTYDAAASGGPAFRVQVPANEGVDRGIQVGTGSNVTAGELWTYVCEVTAVTACSLRLSIQGAGGIAGQDVVDMTAGQTVRFTRSGAALGTGAPAIFILTNTAPAQEFLVRRIMHTKTALPVDYFDGTTRTGRWDSPDFNSAWSGTVNASTSFVRATNLAPAPMSGVSVINGGVVLATTSTGARQVVYSTNSSAIDTYNQLGGYSIQRFLPGKSYTISATCTIVTPLAGAQHATARSLQASHRAGSYWNATAQAPNTAGSHRLTVKMTVPANATEAFVRLFHGGRTGDSDLFWSDLLIVEGDLTDVTAVDGSQAATTVHLYRWVGSANASESERIPRATRRALAKVSDTIQPDVNTHGGSGRFTVGLEIPSGTWEDVVTPDWSAFAVNGKALEVTPLAGGTERIMDAILLVTGPVTNPRITDPATGAYVELQGALTAGQSWRVNVGTWATRTGTLTLNSTDTTGTDAQAITRFGGTLGQAAFLPLVPIRLNGARRVRVTVTGTGITGDTQVAVRARRKYAL